MKILQVMAGARRGGAETAFADMCLALREAGQDVTVVTRPHMPQRGQLEQAGIPVHTLPFGGMIDVYTRWRLQRIIRAVQPAIVQTWMSRAAQKTPRWRPAMKIPRYLVVSRLGGYYKIRNFKSADYFTTITPMIRDYLIAGGIDGGRVRHINNFAETEETVTPIRRADVATPESATLVLGLGRLHPTKAFDTLIRAIAQTPDMHLWIAGEGPERGALEKLIQKLNVPDRVKLLGWRNDRAALLQAADLCTFTSRYEPFGTVFVQAWAQRTPLIVSNADGPRQFVRDGEDGLMVPIDDVQALTAALQRLAADKDLQARLTENGHRRYQQEFTREKTVAAYLDFYREILAREKIPVTPEVPPPSSR